MLDKLTKQLEKKMDKVLASFGADLRSLHTGKATASLVEDIPAQHYNSSLPIKQLANIAVPDPNQIVITPWDKGAMVPIESALRDSGKDFTIKNDGQTIRIALPPMSEERRQELAKVVQSKGQEAKIALRQIREQVWKEVKKQTSQGNLTEDDKYRGEKLLNERINQKNSQIDEMVEAKSSEIKTI